VIKDCELLIAACREHPDDIKKILAALQKMPLMKTCLLLKKLLKS